MNSKHWGEIKRAISTEILLSLSILILKKIPTFQDCCILILGKPEKANKYMSLAGLHMTSFGHKPLVAPFSLLRVNK